MVMASNPEADLVAGDVQRLADTDLADRIQFGLVFDHSLLTLMPLTVRAPSHAAVLIGLEAVEGRDVPFHPTRLQVFMSTSDVEQLLLARASAGPGWHVQEESMRSFGVLGPFDRLLDMEILRLDDERLRILVSSWYLGEPTGAMDLEAQSVMELEPLKGVDRRFAVRSIEFIDELH